MEKSKVKREKSSVGMLYRSCSESVLPTLKQPTHPAAWGLLLVYARAQRTLSSTASWSTLKRSAMSRRRSGRLGSAKIKEPINSKKGQTTATKNNTTWQLTERQNSVPAKVFWRMLIITSSLYQILFFISASMNTLGSYNG